MLPDQSVFASADGEGKLDFWNINTDTEVSQGFDVYNMLRGRYKAKVMTQQYYVTDVLLWLQ